MLDRLPDMQLATGDVVWRTNMNLRGLAALPVTFERVAVAYEQEGGQR
jgi:hypothetical protein